MESVKHSEQEIPKQEFKKIKIVASRKGYIMINLPLFEYDHFQGLILQVVDFEV